MFIFILFWIVIGLIVAFVSGWFIAYYYKHQDEFTLEAMMKSWIDAGQRYGSLPIQVLIPSTLFIFIIVLIGCYFAFDTRVEGDGGGDASNNSLFAKISGFFLLIVILCFACISSLTAIQSKIVDQNPTIDPDNITVSFILNTLYFVFRFIFYGLMTLIVFLLAQVMVNAHLAPWSRAKEEKEGFVKEKGRYTFEEIFDELKKSLDPPFIKVFKIIFLVPFIKIPYACFSYVAHLGTYFDPIDINTVTLETLYKVLSNLQNKHNLKDTLESLANSEFKKSSIASYNESVEDHLQLNPDKIHLFRKKEFKEKVDALLKQMFFLFSPDAKTNKEKAWLHLIPIVTCLISTVVYGAVMQYKILPSVSSSSSLQNEAIQRAFSHGILINTGVIGASYLGILRFFI